jgi:hypothetical protein
MNRKGQGISINMVIIATIALIVLVIAVLLVSKSGRTLSEGTSSCSAQGGVCKLNCDQTDIPKGNTKDCTGSTPNCCVYDYSQ